jgi:hypothetical protein
MSSHSDTLFWLLPNKYLLFLINAACFAKKQQIPNSVIGWAYSVLSNTNPTKNRGWTQVLRKGE